ncbi:hypothetical protein E2C01_025841 [Portunus trituberculatus]|uniref:Uncharacterized protein n=1 Tax=Portunus trituberculatus TaxID=210409 RepID=A0A5B7EGJ4_PORTR|nr:hypothetical protein [Portunus trituberculatus]
MGEITTSILPDWTYTHIRDRCKQIVLARLRIGHTYLTQRYLLTRDPQPYCDDCLVLLTVRHLLVECPSFIDLRHHYLYRCCGRDSGWRQMTIDVAAPYPKSNPIQSAKLSIVDSGTKSVLDVYSTGIGAVWATLYGIADLV